MKRFLFFTFLLFFTSISFGQNLTLSQVLSIRKQNIGNAEEYLTHRKWKFFGAKEPKDGYLGYLDFAYNVSTFDDKAESFLTLYYSNYSSSDNPISIRVVKEAKYNEYVNQIKAWGGKIIKSYVEDDRLYKIYQGSTMTYIVSTFTQDESIYSKKTGYDFLIMTNENYSYSPYSKTLTIKNGPSDYVHSEPSRSSSAYNTNSSSYKHPDSYFSGYHKFKTTFDNPVFEIPLRDKPSVAGRELYKCPKNATVYVIDNSGKDYFKVYVNGYTGYLRNAFLKRKW